MLYKKNTVVEERFSRPYKELLNLKPRSKETEANKDYIIICFSYALKALHASGVLINYISGSFAKY